MNFKHIVAFVLMFGMLVATSPSTFAQETKKQESTESAKPESEKQEAEKQEAEKGNEGAGKSDDSKPPKSEEKPDDAPKKSEDEPKAENGKPEADKADKGSEKKTEEKSKDDNAGSKSKDGQSDKDEAESDSKKPEKKASSRSGSTQKRNSKGSDSFIALFKPIVGSAEASTLEVVSGTRSIALGTVVDSNGFILTKASELRGNVGCRLADGKILQAKVFGVDQATDLAILKIEAKNLNSIKWSDGENPKIGQWVAVPKGEKNSDGALVGVVGVNSRAIPPSKPFIGIQMSEVPEGEIGVIIDVVVKGTPAEKAGLKPKDQLIQLDDIEIENIAGLRKTLEQYDINDRVALKIIREKKEMELKLTLTSRDKLNPGNARSNTQNNMGSTLSRRRKDFPSAFQHDVGLNNTTCGGPIVDLTGDVVGINIARSGRVSTLALPVSTVRPVVEMLMTGDYAPAVVNRKKIEAIDAELVELKESIGNKPQKKDVLELRYQVEKSKKDEIGRLLKDMQERYDAIDEKASNYKEQLEAIRKELKDTERLIQRLEADRLKLSIGSR